MSIWDHTTRVSASFYKVTALSVSLKTQTRRFFEMAGWMSIGGHSEVLRVCFENQGWAFLRIRLPPMATRIMA